MNEEKTIYSIVSSVVALGYTVLVVDDASKDATAEKARSAGAIVVSNVVNIGAWKATQTGLRLAKKKGYNAVVTMDADGQHHASDIEKLVDAYRQGANVVIGNCTSRGSLGRHLAWSFFKVVNRLNINDITSGFRLYGKKALSCLTSRQATMFEYQCVGVLLMMRNSGLTIKEVAVTMDDRSDGGSRIFYSWSAVGYYLFYSGLLSSAKAFPTKKDRYIKRLQD